MNESKKIIIVGQGHVGRAESFAQSLSDNGVIVLDTLDNLVQHEVDKNKKDIITDLINMKTKKAQQHLSIINEESQTHLYYKNQYYNSETPRKNRIAKSKSKNIPIKSKYLGKKNPFKK